MTSLSDVISSGPLGPIAGHVDPVGPYVPEPLQHSVLGLIHAPVRAF